MLKIKSEVIESTLFLYFSGSLNELSSALSEVAIASDQHLHINLKELQAINSVGISAFHRWIHATNCQRIRVFYCPKSFVTQLNMIQGFMPARTEIESFYVPYFSEFTGEEHLVLLQREIDYNISPGRVELNLPRLMDGEYNFMEVDVVRAKYFRFLEDYS